MDADSRPLSPTGTLTVGCERGHRFDANKRGYISLLPPSSRVIGDSQAMLDARNAFFATGSYVPIADAVTAACIAATGSVGTSRSSTSVAPSPSSARVRLAEVGCGTGYYLSTAVSGLDGAGIVVNPIAADLSPFGVRMSVRAVPGSAGVVLDVWQPLPFLDDTVDGILSVFAPRNLPEFARILRPGGFLVAVVPTTRHLQEIRADGLALDIPDGKPDALTEAASSWFTEEARSVVEFGMTLTTEDLDNLIGMGPSAHHRTPSGPAQPDGPSASPDAEAAADGRDANGTDAGRRVTASVTVLTYRLAA
jgi:23S rRNA (guanine745-N1)-methyltransferase